MRQKFRVGHRGAKKIFDFLKNTQKEHYLYEYFLTLWIMILKNSRKLVAAKIFTAKIDCLIPQFLPKSRFIWFYSTRKNRHTFSFANSIELLSFSSVFFQNVKLGFAMTLKEQKFAKISCREISEIQNFARISCREIRQGIIRKN